MRSSDWQPMETAPLNPYGKAYGPVVLIWDRACGNASSAYYEPMHGWRDSDTGPAWVLDDGVGDTAIKPEDAGGWMPLAAPWSEAPNANAIIDSREESGRFSGGSAMPDPVTAARIQSVPDPWHWDGPALRAALEECRPLVLGANHAASRYPTAWAYFNRQEIGHD